MEAAQSACKRLIADDIPYRRPDDYYAEMLKTDDHMLRVKGRLAEQEKHIVDGEQRRKQRELKRCAPAHKSVHSFYHKRFTNAQYRSYVQRLPAGS
jgi:hypothetical protein